MTVTLAWPEVALAANVGCLRRIAALQRGLKNKFGPEPGSPWWQRDIQGACGELALAKYLGVYWHPTVGELGRRDVAGCEVRTRPRTGDALPIRKDDPDGRYVLVTGDAPTYTIVGWVWASDGKQEQYWRDWADGRFLYYVPQDALEDLSSLLSDTPAEDAAA